MDLISIIQPDELSEAIAEELTQYSEEVMRGIKEQTAKKMKDLVNLTKQTAPVGHRSKHYKDNITSKKLVDTPLTVSYLWYVKGDDYRLSHLLNNGHATKNGGRVQGTGFITNAEKQIIQEYEASIEEVIRNGS